MSAEAAVLQQAYESTEFLHFRAAGCSLLQNSPRTYSSYSHTP